MGEVLLSRVTKLISNNFEEHIEKEAMKTIPHAVVIISQMFTEICPRLDIAYAACALGKFQSTIKWNNNPRKCG